MYPSTRIPASTPPATRGLPIWATLLIFLASIVTGMLVAALRGGGIGKAFFLCFCLGAVLSTAIVKIRGLLIHVTLQPIAFVLLTPAAAIIAIQLAGHPIERYSKTVLLANALPVIQGFPWMCAALVISILIAAIRAVAYHRTTQRWLSSEASHAAQARTIRRPEPVVPPSSPQPVVSTPKTSPPRRFGQPTAPKPTTAQSNSQTPVSFSSTESTRVQRPRRSAVPKKKEDFEFTPAPPRVQRQQRRPAGFSTSTARPQTPPSQQPVPAPESSHPVRTPGVAYVTRSPMPKSHAAKEQSNSSTATPTHETSQTRAPETRSAMPKPGNTARGRHAKDD